MISFKTALLAGTVALGLAGFTAYASGTFCTTETAQKTTPTQTILTSGGDKACCAGETEAKKAVAQNAVFTPTVQTTALSGGTCTAQTKQVATKACATETPVKTVSLTETNNNSCCAKEGKTTATKTTLAGVVPTPTTAN